MFILTAKICDLITKFVLFIKVPHNKQIITVPISHSPNGHRNIIGVVCSD